MDSDGRKGELPFKCKKKQTLAKPGSIPEIDDGIGSSKSSKKPLPEHSGIKQRSQNARISCLKEVTIVAKTNAVCSVRKGKEDSYRKKQVALTPADPLPQVRPKQNEDLPVKYKILDSFYEGLEAAVGLLQIRRQMCTFAAVCPTVETMTKRRFLQSHLAQMKYLFPEVVKCESVVCKDPDSHAVKRDIKITLSAFYSQPDNRNSGLLTAGGISRKWSAPTIRRRQEFHKRLLAFATSHPEGDDIPEETLIENPCSKVSEGATSLHGKTGDSHCLPAVETDPKFLTSILDKTTDVEQNNVLQDDMFDPLSASETSKRDQKDQVALLEKVRRPTRNAFANTSLLHESSHFSPAFRRHFSKLPICDDQDGAVTAEKTDTFMAFENTNLECGDSHFSPAFKAHYSKMSACSSVAIQEDYALKVHELLNTSLKNQKETALGEEVELLQKIRKPSRKMPEEADVHVKMAHFSPAFKQHFSKSFFKTTQGDEMGLLEKIHKPSREISADVDLHAENLHFSPAFKQHFSKSDLLAQDVNDISHKQDVQDVTTGEIERGSKETVEQSEISSKDILSFRSNDTKPDVLTAPATPLKDAKLLVEENAIEILEQVETTSFASPLKRMLPSPFGSPLKRTMFSPVTPQNYISKALKSPTSISCNTPDCMYTTPVCGDNNDDPSPLVHSQPIGFKIPKTPSRNSRSVEPSLERRSRVSRGLCFSDKLEDKAVLDANNMSMVSATADLCSKESKNNIQQELDLEVIKCLSPMLLQSIRQKEKRISDDKRNNVAETQRKQQMLAGLPQLFNMLRLVFQSQGRTVIPRKELLQKMESACGDITDRDELEERLQLLVENAPDWISKQTALSGELIYRVKKDADLSAIRKRLIDT